MNRPDWHTFFMGLAIIASRRSHDPRTQVGAVVVDPDNIVLGIGYNGFPRGCSDHKLPTNTPEKYHYMAHAEVNALSNCSVRPKGAKIYVTVYPCDKCAQMIINNQIAEVYYLSLHPDYMRTEIYHAAKTMFEQASVKTHKVTGDFSFLSPVTLLAGKYQDLTEES